MLEKTIKQVLNKKIKAWIESVDDAEVRKVIEKNVIVTGGCIPSFMQNEEPKDYDVYFKTKEAVLKVSKYYLKQWQEAHDGLGASIIDENPESTSEGRIKIFISSEGILGDTDSIGSDEELGINTIETIQEIDETKADEIIDREKKEYFPVFLSSNAITLSSGIQIVARFYGEPNKIHETYDFEHTKSYYLYNDNILEIPKKVYECVQNKTLVYTGSLYPVCSVFRLRKFINRGWKINAGQMLKMCMQISELDLSDINTLQDQLIGVDSSYFMDLIEQFRKQKEENKDFKIDSNYVMSIIDKIF